MGTSARQIALGNVSGFSDSADSVFENPAALYRVDQFSLSLFSSKVMNEVQYNNLALSTKIYEGFIENFLKNYKSIHSQLPLGLDDIRIFDWWNFNSNNKNRFKINTKYTAIINNLDKLSISEIKSGFRYWRRNEYNRINKNISSLEKDNICDLDELYKLYLDITSADTHDLKSNFKLMLDLNKKNFADFIIFRDKENKKIASLIFLLYGKREANVVLNLTSAAWKKKGLSVLSVIESIKIAKKNKKKIFDFNGANSPNRGDDKHSYGAVPKLFFELKYNG